MRRRDILAGGAAMAWTPWGDKPARGRVAGGNPPMRPDQALQPLSRAGVGPAPESPFIIAQRVIVFGTGPARGIFVYSPVPGAGNLIASIAAAAGTDPYGNFYQLGITSYSGSNFLEHSALSLNFNAGGVAAGSLSYDAINHLLELAAIGGTSKIAFIDSSNNARGVLINPGPTLSVLLTPSAVVTGPSTAAMLEIQGTAALQNAAAPTSVSGYAEPFANGGHLNYVAGDGNSYDTGIAHIDLPNTNVTAVTPAFTAISAAQIVAAATYKMHVRGWYTGAAAGTPRFAIAGPATSSAQITAIMQPNGAGVAGTGGLGATLGPVAGPVMAGTAVIVDIWAEATFTGSGTVQFEANTSVLADNFTWNAGIMEVWPVT